MKRVSLLTLAIVLGVGCDKGDPTSEPFLPHPPSAVGSWSGTAPGVLSISMTLQQKRDVVTGVATITNLNNGLSDEGTISGTETYPDFGVTFALNGYVPIVITGRYSSSDEIDAVLNQSGFSDFPITFVRGEASLSTARKGGGQ